MIQSKLLNYRVPTFDLTIVLVPKALGEIMNHVQCMTLARNPKINVHLLSLAIDLIHRYCHYDFIVVNKVSYLLII